MEVVISGPSNPTQLVEVEADVHSAQVRHMSDHVTSYCIMANHIIPLHYMPQRFQGEIGSEMKEEEKEMKETN